jgi:hypothetical protein
MSAKFWRIVFYALCVPPLLFMISLASFYSHAAKILGYSPSYDNPDPKTLSIYHRYQPYIDSTAEVWIWSFLIWFVVTGIYLILKRKQIDWTPLILSFFCHFFAVSLFLSGIMEWYAD